MAVVRDWAKKEIRRAASDPGGKNSTLMPCSRRVSIPLRTASQRGTHLVLLRDEEHGSTESALAILLGRDLMVEESLDVVDREEVLAVHGDDNGVPDLRDEDLGLVLDFHVGRREDLGVHSLRKTLEDVCGVQHVSRNT